MAVRIGGTLGEASINTRAKAEEPWLYGCTDHQKQCWIEVNEYMRLNPDVKVTTAIRRCGYSAPTYYNVKKKAEASRKDAFVCSDRELIRDNDTVVKNARREAQSDERQALVYSTKREAGTPPPRFPEKAPELKIQRWEEPAAPLSKGGGELPLEAYMNETGAEAEPEVESAVVPEQKPSPIVARKWTYQEHLDLYDDVQLKLNELGSGNEKEAAKAIGVPYHEYLGAKAVVEDRLASEAEAKRNENKHEKTIAWEQRIESGCEKGIEKVAMKMRAGLLEVAAMAEPTNPMKLTMAIMQMLEPLPDAERKQVLRTVAAFYGVA